MKIYSVSYDLKQPGQNYEALEKELKNSSSWWHYLQSTWLIYTNESADTLYKRLSSSLDTNDRILVTDIGQDYSGWLPQKAWDWIREHQAVPQKW